MGWNALCLRVCIIYGLDSCWTPPHPSPQNAHVITKTLYTHSYTSAMRMAWTTQKNRAYYYMPADLRRFAHHTRQNLHSSFAIIRIYTRKQFIVFIAQIWVLRKKRNIIAKLPAWILMDWMNIIRNYKNHRSADAMQLNDMAKFLRVHSSNPNLLRLIAGESFSQFDIQGQTPFISV